MNATQAAVSSGPAPTAYRGQSRPRPPQLNASQRIPYPFNPVPIAIQKPNATNDLAHSFRSVLMALVTLSNRHGRPTEGIICPAATVARWAGCSTRTVTRALPDLVEAGHIALHRVPLQNAAYGERYVYRYQVVSMLGGCGEIGEAAELSKNCSIDSLSGQAVQPIKNLTFTDENPSHHSTSSISPPCARAHARYADDESGARAGENEISPTKAPVPPVTEAGAVASSLAIDAAVPDTADSLTAAPPAPPTLEEQFAGREVETIPPGAAAGGSTDPALSTAEAEAADLERRNEQLLLRGRLLKLGVWSRRIDAIFKARTCDEIRQGFEDLAQQGSVVGKPGAWLFAHLVRYWDDIEADKAAPPRELSEAEQVRAEQAQAAKFAAPPPRESAVALAAAKAAALRRQEEVERLTCARRDRETAAQIGALDALSASQLATLRLRAINHYSGRAMPEGVIRGQMLAFTEADQRCGDVADDRRSTTSDRSSHGWRAWA